MEADHQVQRLRHAAYASGRQTWPSVCLDQTAFDEWAIAQQIDGRALSSHGPDLFLASGCAAGNPQAIAAFEKAYVQNVHPTVGRRPLVPEMLDELRQTLRVRLLTGPSPKIGRYKGSGPLGAWVRVTAARIALELKKASEHRTTSDSAVTDALVAAETGPELVAAKLQHRDLFRTELECCFRNLEPRDRTLLRLHFLHGMSMDQMGTVLRVHRATVARWMVALRRQIVEHLCAALEVQIQGGSAVKSLIRLVWDDIELSVDRLLDTATPASPEAVDRPQGSRESPARPETPPEPAPAPDDCKSAQQRKPIE
jgi:RNA polymerase sigma-70 factor, ECF subfamily